MFEDFHFWTGIALLLFIVPPRGDVDCRLFIRGFNLIHVALSSQHKMIIRNMILLFDSCLFLGLLLIRVTLIHPVFWSTLAVPISQERTQLVALKLMAVGVSNSNLYRSARRCEPARRLGCLSMLHGCCVQAFLI